MKTEHNLIAITSTQIKSVMAASFEKEKKIYSYLNTRYHKLVSQHFKCVLIHMTESIFQVIQGYNIKSFSLLQVIILILKIN